MSESQHGFLIDTNVVCEFVRPKPSLQVKRWFEFADPESLFASVVTFGEIRLGIEDLPVGKRRAALERWLEEDVPEWFQANLLPVTKAAVNDADQINSVLQREVEEENLLESARHGKPTHPL